MITRRSMLALAAAPGVTAIAALPRGSTAREGLAQASADALKSTSSDWRETYAYTLGVQAYIFGFPYVYLPSLRWSWVTQPKPAGGSTPYAALNHFHHVRMLADANYRDGGSPNNDTLYSIAWLDVSKEPVIISHPDMGERYFTFEIASLDSDNFAYVGTRTTGGRAGNFAIIGPGWQGRLPRGVKALPTSRTNSVLIMGRTLVDDPVDVKRVNALQDKYSLVPLSLHGRAGARLPESHDVWAPFDLKADPLAEWKTMNRAMTEDPPEERLAKLIGLFARIGVGPGQDVEKRDEPTRRGLARAAIDGRTLLAEASRSGLLGTLVNNWSIPPKALGRAGLSDDFLLRGATQCLGGIVANDPDEAVYFNTALDATGLTFDGGREYLLRFAPGQLPKVNAFWSLSLYDPTFNFTPNSINRYSIGDRTAGLKRDTDGGLTISIQREKPTDDKVANWLPTTESGSFKLILRTYLPGRDIVEQKWAPPAVQRIR
jgi:hypothetical protein